MSLGCTLFSCVYALHLFKSPSIKRDLQSLSCEKKKSLPHLPSKFIFLLYLHGTSSGCPVARSRAMQYSEKIMGKMAMVGGGGGWGEAATASLDLPLLEKATLRGLSKYAILYILRILANYGKTQLSSLCLSFFIFNEK